MADIQISHAPGPKLFKLLAKVNDHNKNKQPTSCLPSPIFPKLNYHCFIVTVTLPLVISMHMQVLIICYTI